MGFVKVIKSKAYFKRFQVQFRRRREAKTDYYARKRLVWQDKNKYAAPKHRLVVRFTNRDVVVAVVASDINGDRVVRAAYGHELSRYGLKFGFNSWAATYATGLLLARKVNAHFKLPFLGSKDAVNGYYNVGEADAESVDESGVDADSRRPFKAILDVGLHRTTTGSRIFAAVKGACDGGINVPHSTRRFPGTPAEKGAETDFEVTRKYIFGGHIAEYMNQLAEEDEEAFATQFAVAKAAGIKGDDLEAIFQGIHDKIRAESAEDLLKKNRDVNKLGYFKTRATPKDVNATYKKVAYKKSKLPVQQKKARIVARIKQIAFRKSLLASAQ